MSLLPTLTSSAPNDTIQTCVCGERTPFWWTRAMWRAMAASVASSLMSRMTKNRSKRDMIAGLRLMLLWAQERGEDDEEEGDGGKRAKVRPMEAPGRG